MSAGAPDPHEPVLVSTVTRPSPAVNPRLQAIADVFQTVEPADRAGLLAEYAGRLAPLPAELQRAVDAGLGRVHECETPLFVFPAVRDGAVHVYAYAPPQSATARAFAALLAEVLDGEPPEAAAEIPDAPQLIRLLGLERILVTRRQVGVQGLIRRVKESVAQAAADAE